MSGVIEALMASIMGALKLEISDYCDLETADGKTALITSDGAYGSIIKYNGIRSVISKANFLEMAGRLSDAFEPYMRKKGYSLQVMFMRDDDSIVELNRCLQARRESTRAMGINMDDLLDEWAKTMSAYTYSEECYLVLWTSPELLNAAEVRKQASERNKDKRRLDLPAFASGQNPFISSDYLKAKHEGYVGSIYNILNGSSMSCSVELLDVRQACRAVRRSIYARMTHDSWEPALPGDPHGIMWKENEYEGDLSEILYPPLSRQIMARSAEIGSPGHPIVTSPNRVKVGNRVFSPVIIEVPPRKPEVFEAFFSLMNNTHTRSRGITRACPYAISFMIKGDGINALGWNSMLATILSFASTENKALYKSVENLRAIRESGQAIVKFSITAMTWIDEDDNVAEDLPLREKALNDALQQWGHPQVGERTGDPMAVVQSTALALSCDSVGVPSAAPLYDVMTMLPFSRPASPFSSPSGYYRSMDGKLWPYRQFSSDQSTWATLFFGKPGSGKSVAMNGTVVESLWLPGQKELPYIGMIDIGVSSSGALNLIKESLPKERRHLVVHRTLVNDRSCGINPLDTYLGLREPVREQMDNICAFITALVTPAERFGKPLQGMSSFVQAVLLRAYATKSDQSATPAPTEYTRGRNQIVDDAVIKLQLNVMDDESVAPLTYWEITDACFQAGMLHEAEVAQRYAVPIINDLVEAASALRGQFEHIRTDNNTPIVDEFINGAQYAVAEYPMFADVTCFDLGSARIIGLDLQNVASDSTSMLAVKQSSLMYMMALDSFMRKIAIYDEMVGIISTKAPLYATHYKSISEKMVDVKKVLAIDEVHVTRNNPTFAEIIERYLRTGRKRQLAILQASQRLMDMEKIIGMCTSFFIMEKGSSEEHKLLEEKIGLTDEERDALKLYVNGPTREGTNILGRFNTNRSFDGQVITLTVGPKMLWAMSTTAEDMRLRNALYDRIGTTSTRALLAERFPHGSCKRYLEERTIQVQKHRGFDLTSEEMELANKSEVEKLVEELYKVYCANPSKYEASVMGG